ncbi:MAG TPA: amidohydrolase family protein, partial [Thermoleophilia bacterium]|nr:amidohydrolase family protein [Thermoleophilia bacterium]
FEGLMLGEFDILRVMIHAKSLGLVVALHCESETITAHLGRELKRQGLSGVEHYSKSRPPIAERLAIEQAIALGETAGCPVYIVHVTTADGVSAIRRAMARGLPVYGETCPHYLLLDERLLNAETGEAVKYFTGPPLRAAADAEALWNGLRQGDLQVVATDHCAWRVEQKRASQAFDSVPVGLPGLETRLPLLFTEAVGKRGASIQDFVRWTSTNPAKIFGLYPRKGSLSIGADADLVLWDPTRRVKLESAALHQGSDYCPYEGYELRGYPVMTILRGHVVVDRDEFTGAAGMGRRVERSRHAAGRAM